ncbi:hypothetical protein FSPOR_1419 [Fusarium sporotrichioides]|uniref:Uncharacterized protein n=1 Tax=Fusarium sporotrichioides TaxID=5514 RepID=A0A395SPK7_FUSSP|nr:hypothetical protein FSPOR_1419 [Fusarium sporotrichioides]
MSPPPSTPTPRRFLLPKRGTQSSQTPTGLPRFQSTPRFASSSVPRPTQARAGIDIEDVEEVEDRTQASSQDSQGDKIALRKYESLHDSIQVESDDATASQDACSVISDNEIDVKSSGFFDREASNAPSVSHEVSPLEEREPKRRRVSISPMQQSSPVEEQHYMVDEDPEDIHEREQAGTQESTQSIQDAVIPYDESKTLHQPTFREPPRFKQVELDTAADGIPAAFSPQRRGAKYIPGGLAAELQGWLSEVKGWEGVVPAPASNINVIVEEVRVGRRFCLVKGRSGMSEGKRFLLAGEGRLTGLGQRMPMSVGSVVEVGQPVWDIEMKGEVWMVACDWKVS